MLESVFNQVGVVIIGRNEGCRLVKCFDSIQNKVKEIVYVDSGSTDDSVAASIGRGIHTIELDMAIPFTAARARNEGFNRLTQLHPDLKYVQFVDGDCEVVEGWLSSAVQFLEKSERVAVVCGRRRERFPAASVYNMLCDIEWDTPVGEAKACGGDAMMRVDAFQQVNGFRESLIAGEEPELCVRLRDQGWKIWRLDVEMTLHDAAMTEFGQWWKRSIRAGYAFAAGAYLHGRSPERHWVKETRSAWIWGLLIPLGTISAMYFFGLWALVLLLSYPVQVARLTYAGNKGSRVNFIRALFLVLGKFPEIYGVLKFLINRIMNIKARLIEYK
jgi:GT2 family glycosyltransferase